MDEEDLMLLNDVTAEEPDAPGVDDAQELDGAGNPIGTEYELDGVPVDWQGNPVEVVTEEEVAPVVEEPAAEVAPYKPPVPQYNLPGMSEEDRARINEMALAGDFVGAQLELNKYVRTTENVASAVSGYHLEQAAAEHPEFYRVHRHTVEAILAQAPPEKRALPETVREATAIAIYQEIQQTGDLAGTILRAAELLKPMTKPTASTVRPQVQPPRPIPPTQRTTTPAVSAQPVTRPQVRRSGVSSEVKTLMETFDITADQAQKIIDQQPRSTRR